jgi:sulfite reductase beta subunit-like hemoprotein
MGKAVRQDDVPGIVDRLARFYLAQREAGERFIDTVERLGAPAFKTMLEPEAEAAA